MRSSLHSDSKAGLGTHLSDGFESGLEMAQKQISANNSIFELQHKNLAFTIRASCLTDLIHKFKFFRCTYN